MTPDDIASRTFAVSMRGFDRREVSAYLRAVADEVAVLQRRIADLEGELGRPRPAAALAGEGIEPDEAFRLVGEETTRLLATAQTSAQRIQQRAEEAARARVDAAHRAAEEQLSEARREADAILAEAHAARAKVAQQIRELEQVRDQLVERLQRAVAAVGAAVGDLVPEATQAPHEGSMPSEPTAATADTEEPGQVASERAEAAEPSAEATGEPGPHPAEPHPAAPRAEPAEPGPPEAETEPTRGSSETEPEPVADGGPAASPRAADQVAGPEPAGPEGAEQVSAPDRDTPPDAIDRSAPSADDPHGIRDRSLAGVRPALLRRLKRALQDVQNGVLDALRQARGTPVLDDLLPGDDDLAGLGVVSRTFLTAAFRAGHADARLLVGRDQAEVTTDDEVTALATALADTVAHELRATLTPSLRAGIDAGEPETSLSERVGEVFRDLKGPVVEGAVEQHLRRAYHLGSLAAWRQVGVGTTRWVLGDEPRCPENRCRTNAGEGPVAIGEPFPSGDLVPPAHDACVCALLPA